MGRRLATVDKRVARADDGVVPLPLEQQIEPQAVGVGVVADGRERGIPGRQGVVVAMIERQQPASIGLVTRQPLVSRFFEPNCLVQVAQGLRAEPKSNACARLTSARPRYKGAKSGFGLRSIASPNCSTASSGLPCLR